MSQPLTQDQEPEVQQLAQAITTQQLAEKDSDPDLRAVTLDSLKAIREAVTGRVAYGIPNSPSPKK
jgi:hypothetical protein